MRGFLLSVAGLGVGGAAWVGMDGPDFDRTINRSPAAVYAAYSALSQEGTVAAIRDRFLALEGELEEVGA